MKKLILLFVVLAFAVSANAQRTGKLSTSQSIWNPTIVAADTLHTTGAITFVLDINRDVPTTQDIYVRLDSLRAVTPGVSAQMKGKKFAEQAAYTNIGSPIVWYGSADTAFVMSNDTAVRYRYIALTLTGTASNTAADILDVQFKIWKE